MRKLKPSKRVQVKDALAEFCDDIEATGGVVKLDGGNYALDTDLDWIDLAETYLKACKVLGRKPKIVK